MSKVRHIKTGNQYQTLGQAINTTNAHNNQKMKAYVKEEDVNKLKQKFSDEEIISYVNGGSIDVLFTDLEIFVRECDEFETKFEEL